MKWGRGIALVLLLVTAACGDEPAPKRAKRPKPPRTPPPPVAELEARARTGELEDRDRAIEQLGDHRIDEPDDEHHAAQQILLDLLTDPAPEIQRAAIYELTSASFKTVEAIVLARIRDPDDPDRDLLLEQLAGVYADDAELAGRAVAAALVDPDSDLAGVAIEALHWTAEPWPVELHAALDRVISTATDPLRVLAACQQRAGFAGPARARELVARVVELARAHPVAADARRGAKIRGAVLSALGELGPEASAATPLLLEYLLEQDYAESFGALAQLGPAAGDAIPVMFRWLAERDGEVEPDDGSWSGVGPALQLMLWPLSYGAIGFVPAPLRERARDQLRAGGNVSYALDLAAMSHQELLTDVLKAWPRMDYQSQESALAVLLRGGVAPAVLLPLAREVWLRWWRRPSLVAAAILLGHEVPGPAVQRAEQYLRQQLVHGDGNTRNAAWTVLAIAPPRAAQRFRGEAWQLVRENWRTELEAPGLRGAAALLLRAGGADSAEVADVLREVLKNGIGVYVVATIAEVAGEAARMLLPDVLAFAGSGATAERLWTTQFLRTVAVDTPEVRAALARLRDDPWHLVRHWAVGAIYRLDNP